MVDDIESVEEENNLKLVIDDFISTEKETTLQHTGKSQLEYDAIEIPETYIDSTKTIEDQDTPAMNHDETTKTTREVKQIHIMLGPCIIQFLLFSLTFVCFCLCLISRFFEYSIFRKIK